MSSVNKLDLPTWTILTYPFLAATWSGVLSYLSYSSTSVLPLLSFRRNCKVAWRKIKIQNHGNTYFLSLLYMYTDGQWGTDKELWFQAELVFIWPRSLDEERIKTKQQQNLWESRTCRYRWPVGKASHFNLPWNRILTSTYSLYLFLWASRTHYSSTCLIWIPPG